MSVVLVTGASGGLGRAVVHAFLDDGATVVGVARSAPSMGSAIGVAADLTSAAGARAAVAEALQRAGRLDALVHLMGGFAGGNPVAQTDDETWHSMMNMNLHSAFYIARPVLAHMMEQRRGRIVMVGSRPGVEPVATLAAYSASKAGLIALTKAIAAEVKSAGITANVILPSTIDTPANRAAMPNADFSKWVAPESIARLIVWLASDQAADVNGAAIPIYGRA